MADISDDEADAAAAAAAPTPRPTPTSAPAQAADHADADADEDDEDDEDEVPAMPPARESTSGDAISELVASAAAAASAPAPSPPAASPAPTGRERQPGSVESPAVSPSNYQPINNYVHETAARPTVAQGLSPAAGATDAQGGRSAASEPSVVAVTSASRIGDANDPLVQAANRACSHAGAGGLSNGDAASHNEEDGQAAGASLEPAAAKGGGGSKKSKSQARAKAQTASEKKGPWHAGLECDEVTRANVARLRPAVYLKKRMPPKTAPEFSALTTPAQRILHAQLFDRGIYEYELSEGARLGQQERINAAAETARIRAPLPVDKTVDELVSLLALPDIPWSVFKRAPHCPMALRTHYEALSPNERRLIRMNWHVIDVRSESELQEDPRNGLIGAVFCRVVPDSDGTISEWKEPHIHELALTKIHMKNIVDEEKDLTANGQAGFVHLTRGSIRDTLRASAFTSGQNAIAQTMAEKRIDGMVIGELARRGATGGDAPVLSLTHAPTAPPPPPPPPAATTVTTTQTRLQLVPAPAPVPAPAATPPPAFEGHTVVHSLVDGALRIDAAPAAAPAATADAPPAPAPASAPAPTPAPAPAVAAAASSNGKRKAEYELVEELSVPIARDVTSLGGAALALAKAELLDHEKRYKRVRVSLEFFE